MDIMLRRIENSTYGKCTPSVDKAFRSEHETCTVGRSDLDEITPIFAEELCRNSSWRTLPRI